ncbi:MAG: hypothetical protein U5J99_07085 [Parvularculaceae bacterium]|nr:hypothetical protein [Parvularculaceae bacterium]
MNQRRFCAVLAASALFPLTADASPWNRADGGIFVSTRTDYFRSSTDISAFERVDTDTYVEWGVTDRWMAGGKAVFGSSFITDTDGSRTVSGFGESDVFVQRQLQRGEHSATSLRAAGVWSGDITDGARPGETAGGFDIDLRALHGRDILLKPFKVFIAAEAGYRHRLSDAADQARAEFLVGLEPSRRLLVLLEAQSIISIQNNASGFDDFDVIKAQGTLVWRATKRWSVTAGVRTEFAARNIEPGDAYSLGFWTEF